jgi:predicted nucleic acid-binding protein
MSYLIDTNVFLRLVPQSDPDRVVVLAALRKLRANKEELFYTTQVLIEFWSVCTRPATTRSGYGLTAVETERKARIIERYCRLLPETLATHQQWRRLVIQHAVLGVQVHDAMLAAVMHVHGVTHLLTFNKPDFKRFQGVVAVNPVDV